MCEPCYYNPWYSSEWVACRLMSCCGCLVGIWYADMHGSMNSRWVPHAWIPWHDCLRVSSRVKQVTCFYHAMPLWCMGAAWVLTFRHVQLCFIPQFLHHAEVAPGFSFEAPVFAGFHVKVIEVGHACRTVNQGRVGWHHRLELGLGFIELLGHGYQPVQHL